MAKQINFSKNGEWASEDVLSRPLKELLNMLGDFTPGVALTTGDFASQEETQQGIITNKVLSPFSIANLIKKLDTLEPIDTSVFYAYKGLLDFDANTILPLNDGYYRVNKSTTAQHLPVANADGVLLMFSFTAVSGVQTFYTNTNQTWKRTYDNNAWTGWVCLEAKLSEIINLVNGLTKSSAIDSDSEETVATSKAVKIVADMIKDVSERIKKSSAIDSDSEETIATSKAVKIVADMVKSLSDNLIKSSAIDSDSETDVATSKAVKTVADMIPNIAESLEDDDNYVVPLKILKDTLENIESSGFSEVDVETIIIEKAV